MKFWILATLMLNFSVHANPLEISDSRKVEGLHQENPQKALDHLQTIIDETISGTFGGVLKPQNLIPVHTLNQTGTDLDLVVRAFHIDVSPVLRQQAKSGLTPARINVDREVNLDESSTYNGAVPYGIEVFNITDLETDCIRGQFLDVKTFLASVLEQADQKKQFSPFRRLTWNRKLLLNINLLHLRSGIIEPPTPQVLFLPNVGNEKALLILNVVQWVTGGCVPVEAGAMSGSVEKAWAILAQNRRLEKEAFQNQRAAQRMIRRQNKLQAQRVQSASQLVKDLFEKSKARTQAVQEIEVIPPVVEEIPKDLPASEIHGPAAPPPGRPAKKPKSNQPARAQVSHVEPGVSGQ